jgi:hypothetical protein
MLFLTNGGAVEAAVELCAGWGVKTSVGSVSRCYSAQAFAWRLERARIAADSTKALPNFETEQARLLQQKIFETLASADCDPKVLIALRGLEISAMDLKLKERRVVILENNQAQAKALLEGIKSKGGLTRETLAEIEKAAKLL